ncbi:MAG TPA: hypothetical protein VG675_05130 [Bryobacteraceae bacterium]|nr:hypothetical protein [Bryobacteraceae bacterium]
MRPTLWPAIAIAILTCVYPIAAVADVSGTTTLQANTALNLDTGTTGSSGGDLLWNGSTLAPQGKTVVYVGLPGLGFSGYEPGNLNPFKVLSSAAAIPSTKLAVGTLLAVFTNGGNTAIVMVNANSGGSLTLQFLTFEAAVPTGPTVTDILNNSSGTPAGLPNSGVAPSSLFVVRGTGLADPGDPVLQDSTKGLPLTLNGASITVVVNGVTTHPALYYTSPTQLAAVLPAATPVGTGKLTVSYKGATSAPATIQVVPSAVGINFYYTNSGVATDAISYALLTYNASGFPGEIVTIWATGLGADPNDSDTTYTSTPNRVNTPLQVYIGGQAATIIYQGASTYPGVNQINVIIPDAAPEGCWVPLIAVTGGVISNAVTLPIKKGGGGCVDSLSGLTASQIVPSGGQTLRTGLVALLHGDSVNSKGVRTVTDSTDAAFEKYTGLYTPTNSVSPGGCIVGPPVPVPLPSLTGLEPGTITLTGPGGLNVTLGPQFGIKGAFFSALADGAIPQSGGTFTFKGSGGADVGPFTIDLPLSNPLLTWTNPASGTLDRTQPLKVTWTGGNPGSYVIISGDSSVVSGQNVTTVSFTCLTTADVGQFTVPTYVLSALPAGNGGVDVQNDIQLPLNASGIDIGIALAGVSYTRAVTFK